MTKTFMKAVGAIATGRNRKVRMRTVDVIIYYDEGSRVRIPSCH